MHQRSLQQLTIEILKAQIRIAPIIMNRIFTFVENNSYNLRSGTPSKQGKRAIYTIQHGIYW